MTKRYLIVIEGTSTGYSAYSPDLPGCVATGTDLCLTQVHALPDTRLELVRYGSWALAD